MCGIPGICSAQVVKGQEMTSADGDQVLGELEVNPRAVEAHVVTRTSNCNIAGDTARRRPEGRLWPVCFIHGDVVSDANCANTCIAQRLKQLQIIRYITAD